MCVYGFHIQAQLGGIEKYEDFPIVSHALVELGETFNK
jgi:hypothetical protein